MISSTLLAMIPSRVALAPKHGVGLSALGLGPYLNRHTLYPSKADCTSWPTSPKTSSWEEVSVKTLSRP